MGQSTDGQICYGIMCEEGFEFPWEDYGEEEWWLKVKGIKVANYKKNPMPVTLVNYCSGECPMWIIATPSSTKSARRGYPEEIAPVLSADPGEVDRLLEFVREYLPELKGEPKWYLSSYWG